MKAPLIALAFASLPALAAAQYVSERDWLYRADDTLAQFMHAVPETDDVGLTLSCTKDTGQVTVGLRSGRTLGVRQVNGAWVDDIGRPAPWPVSVTVASGAVSTVVPGQATFDELDGGSYVTAELSDRAPVIEAFARTGDIRVEALGAQERQPPARPGDVRRFLRFCR